jgi:hypothetical protein
MSESYADTVRKAFKKYGKMIASECAEKPEFKGWPHERIKNVLSYINHKEYRDKWKKDNPLRITLFSIRSRCRQRNTYFNLELEDLREPSHCPVLGIPLDRRDNDHAPSVDRFDNTKGYTKDNINIISQRANRMKTDATLEEIGKLYRWMKKNS